MSLFQNARKKGNYFCLMSSCSHAFYSAISLFDETLLHNIYVVIYLCYTMNPPVLIPILLTVVNKTLPRTKQNRRCPIVED